MDDRSALIAREVAMAASAWRHAPSDTEAYRRLIAAVDSWDAHLAPRLTEPDEIAERIRELARTALFSADDVHVQKAFTLAVRASDWLQERTSTNTYRLFIAAIDDWDTYSAPQLQPEDAELLDSLGEMTGPIALADLITTTTTHLIPPAPGAQSP